VLSAGVRKAKIDSFMTFLIAFLVGILVIVAFVFVVVVFLGAMSGGKSFGETIQTGCGCLIVIAITVTVGAYITSLL